MQLATYPKNDDTLYDGIKNAFRGTGIIDGKVAVTVDSGTDYHPPNGWQVDGIDSSEATGEITIWIERDDS